MPVPPEYVVDQPSCLQWLEEGLKEVVPGQFPSGLDSLAPSMLEIFHRLYECGLVPGGEGSVTREAFTAGGGEARAIDYLAGLAAREGLETGFDAVGNFTMTLPGADRTLPRVVCGSHLDSVPQGGNFDGAAGVVAGLLCMIHMRRSGMTPQRTVQTVAWRSEEGPWFGNALLGSKAAVGAITPSLLRSKHISSGRALLECFADIGADTAAIAAGRATLDTANIHCYYELHIEQGPLLAEHQVPVGVVTGIRGHCVHPQVVIKGEESHSGATPRSHRRDAVLAASELFMRLDGLWTEYEVAGKDLVWTVGVLHTDPTSHALTKIPGHVTFAIDIRSQDADTLTEFYNNFRSVAAEVAAKRAVEITFDTMGRTEPYPIAPDLQERLLQCAQESNISAVQVPSGAGHDAMIVGHAGVPSAMLFVRSYYGSHNPREAMHALDFLSGVEVLYNALISP